MLEKILRNDEELFKAIEEIDKMESKELKDYTPILGKLSKNLPPVSKEKHNIWVSIFPTEQYFLDIVGNGKEVEKIIYFVKSGAKTEITFNKKGEVKKKEKVSMTNYPRYYKAIKEEWGTNYKELNKERVILHNGSGVVPYSKVSNYLEGKRANRQAVMLNPDNVLEDRYNSIRNIYKYFWNMDIYNYIISYKKKLYTIEGADWVEIYVLDSDNR